MGGALWEGMGWICLIFIVVQQPTAREWLTRFHASFLTDDLILPYKVAIFWVKPWVTPKTWLHGDSGSLIICTFLYFVYASTTSMLCYTKMWFMWFLWHGDVRPGPLWFIFMKWQRCWYAGCWLGWFRGGVGGVITFLKVRSWWFIFIEVGCWLGRVSRGVVGCLITFLIVRSWWFIHWSDIRVDVTLSTFCGTWVDMFPSGSCTWSDIRVDTLCMVHAHELMCLLMVHAHEVTYVLIRCALFVAHELIFFLMVHVHEVTYVLIPCALFVAHELICLLMVDVHEVTFLLIRYALFLVHGLTCFLMSWTGQTLSLWVHSQNARKEEARIE